MRRALALGTIAATVALALVTGGAATAARRSVLPDGYRAQSQSWISSSQGWILGVIPCGSSNPCTTVLGTTDGGSTWNTLGTLAAPMNLETPTGVTQMRFADALHGWAFWPSFWATTDGGVTWQRQAPPGRGHQVLAVAADATVAYAVVSPCRLNHICGQPLTLWKATPAEGIWTKVALSLPASTSPLVLAVHGTVAYLDIPAGLLALGLDPDTLDVTVDGTTWTARPDPCNPSNGETLTSVAPISDTKVALLCQGNIGFGQAVKRILRSNDNAQTTFSAGTTPLNGIVSQLAGAPNGTLALSSWGAPGSWIYRNTGGKTWTTSVSLNDFGEGWNDITFVSNLVGFAVYGPEGVWPYNRTGELWETTDGGVTWAPV
jgi:photosystem II stability/assembly factor-like uncharacterized protein